MLANAKYIYALDMWTVEKRPNGWYFSKSAYHGEPQLRTMEINSRRGVSLDEVLAVIKNGLTGAA
jgi:hypothetical protein